MKKYILNIVFVLSAVFVYAAPEPYGHLPYYTDTEKRFFDNLIKGNPASYSICVDSDVTNKIKHKISDVFIFAVNQWLNTTKRYITLTPSLKKEFADIIKIIDNHQLVEQTCGSDTDIKIFLKNDVSQICTGSHACYFLEDNIIYLSAERPINRYYKIIVGQEPLFNATMTHELGHAFGLSDRYKNKLYDESHLYHTTDKFPSTIMKNNGGNNFVTCDDVDGFITSIDRMRNVKRTFDSFCLTGKTIVNGKEKYKEGDIYNFKEEYKYFDTDFTVIYGKFDENIDKYNINVILSNFGKSGNKKMVDDVLLALGISLEDIQGINRDKIKVQVKGSVMERNFSTPLTKGKIYLMPIDNWTITLFVEEQKEQVIFIDFANKILDDILYEMNEPVTITRYIIPDIKTEKINHLILFPFIHYEPAR